VRRQKPSDSQAVGYDLAPEFTESTRGCGPEKPRNSRDEYLATFAAVVQMQPKSYRRERGQLEVKLLGDGRSPPSARRSPTASNGAPAR
jgi:hypothetical protein